MHKPAAAHGFTLIELSIVLVIIGLVIGGVLVGRDLIKAAEVRAQVKQIEEFQTAAHTFKSKYNCHPGDCPTAAAYGFNARGAFAGQGDNNGVIEGVDANLAGRNQGHYQGAGETVLFWSDLSGAQLIPGQYTLASATTVPNIGGGTAIPTAELGNYFPASKLLGGHYVFIYSENGRNYYSVQSVFRINTSSQLNQTNPIESIPVQLAHNMDVKMDDGFPQTGIVTARFIHAAGIGWASAGGIGAVPGAAESATASTCYDNGGVAGAVMQYTLNQGNRKNCTASVAFQ